MHDFIKDTIYLQTTTESLQQGQLPYWQHVTCGGQPILGNPETNVISLGTLVSLITGPTIGLKLMIIIEIAIMAAGFYFLGRVIGLSPIGAIMPALILPLSGFD